MRFLPASQSSERTRHRSNRRGATPRGGLWVSLLVFALFSSPPLVAQAALGGEVRIQHSALYHDEVVDVDDDGALDPAWKYGLLTVVKPILAFGGEYFSFVGSVDLAYGLDSSTLTVELPELQVDIYPTSFSLLRLGRFRHLPGTAEFFSPTNYFVRTDIEALLTGNRSAYQLPTELVQASVFFGDFFLRTTLAPVRAETVLPAVDSPWFPGKDLSAIPDPIVIPSLFGDYTHHFRDIYYDTAEERPALLSDYGYSVEAGGGVYGVDFNVSYFDGWSAAPVFSYQIFLVRGVYDIIIRPELDLVRALGLSGSTSFGPVRVWLDSSYTFGRGFATTRLATPPPVETEIDEHNALDATLGASVELAAVDTILALEYSRLFIVGVESEGVVMPALSHVLGASASMHFLDYRLRPAVFGLVAFGASAGTSAAIACEVTYAPSPEWEVALRAPFFLGPADSDLGQFAGTYLISAGITVRF